MLDHFGLLAGYNRWMNQSLNRGQATTLFSQCGVDPGATDLLLRIPAAD